VWHGDDFRRAQNTVMGDYYRATPILSFPFETLKEFPTFWRNLSRLVVPLFS